MIARALAATALVTVLVGCLPELTVATCYSTADCPRGSVCVSAACVPEPDAGVGEDCTIEPSIRVRSVAHAYGGDRVPPAALAFDGTDFWVVVEDVAGAVYELYTVKISAEGRRRWSEDADPVTRGRTGGEPVGPFLEQGPSGLLFGWNERATAAELYAGRTGILDARGVVGATDVLAGNLDALVPFADGVLAALTLYADNTRPGLQLLGTSTVVRLDPALFAPSAARTPRGEWQVVVERGQTDLILVELDETLVVQDSTTLIDGSREPTSAPRARWTGDALSVLYAATTTAGRALRLVEVDAVGDATGPPLTLTASIADDTWPELAYSVRRDELAVVYTRDTRVELLRRSRRTGARVVSVLSPPTRIASDPLVVSTDFGYAAAWLEQDETFGHLLRLSRVVCR